MGNQLGGSPIDASHREDIFGGGSLTLQTEDGETPKLSTFAAAHSIAEKFLILCAFDPALRVLFETCENLRLLKKQQTGVLLSAARAAQSTSSSVSPVSDRKLALSVHRHIRGAGVLKALRTQLVDAVWEALDEEDVPLASALQASKTAKAVSAGEESDDEYHHGRSEAEGLVDSWIRAYSGGTDEDSSLLTALLPMEGMQRKCTEELMRREDSKQTGLGVIRLAPLRVSLKRRRETFCTLLVWLLLPGSFAAILLTLLFFRKTWPVILLYFPWAIWFDRTPERGGRRAMAWIRDNPIWRNYAAYFPVSLIKANPGMELNPKRQYLIGYHPHGILSTGAQLAYGTEACGWSQLFPGLTPKVCTLVFTTRFPFLREILLSMGVIAASEKSIRASLKPGNAVVIVVGGASEALDAVAGQYVITLRRRTGFFRIAISTGSMLVPSFGFGENDLFDALDTRNRGWLRALQKFGQEKLSFSMPLFHGRGVFTYNFGMLPHRRPLTVVVGDPIDAGLANPNPSPEVVAELRDRYIAALTALFEEWKPRLAGRGAELIVL